VSNLAQINPDEMAPGLFSGETSSDITFKIFYSELHDEITGLLKCQNDYGIACARSKVIKNFVYRLNVAHQNEISTRSHILQEMYLLHQICKAFYYYNQQYLGFSHREFRAKVLFPNIIYILMKHFHKARKFIQSTIRSIYSERKNQSNGLVQRFAGSYYLDDDIIKNDILYEFLGNALKKFNPLELKNIKFFYKQTFRQIFTYYFMREEKVHTSYTSMWDMDTVISQVMNIPTRLVMYRDVLYSLQTDKFCKTSSTLNQLNYNYTVFRNVIVANELQDIFFSCKTDIFMLDDKRYKLMKVYSQDEHRDELIEKIKKLPTIYRLLKCVHIVNPKAKPYNEMMIKPENVQSAVLEELMMPFKNMFSESHVYGILNKIAHNFTRNILSGEYINLLTLSAVRINQISFITQVRKFVQICISENMVRDD